MDDKDLEIARLKGQLEARSASSGGGTGIGTLKVLGVLAALAFGGLFLLVVIGEMLPDEPTLDERQAECRRLYGEEPSDGLNQCLLRNIAAEIRRQNRR